MYERKKTKKAAGIATVFFILLVLLRFIIEVLIELQGKELHTLKSFFLLLNVLLFWCALDIFSYKKTVWWMEITFFYYAAHPVMTDFFKKLSAILLPNTQFYALVSYFATVAICLGIIGVVARILLRCIPGLWKLLNGGRIPSIKEL